MVVWVLGYPGFEEYEELFLKDCTLRKAITTHKRYEVSKEVTDFTIL